jgi:hypothetical protein
MKKSKMNNKNRTMHVEQRNLFAFSLTRTLLHH